MPRRSPASCSTSCSGTSSTAWGAWSIGKCRLTSPLTFHPHDDAPSDHCRLIGQGAVRQKPIQKEHIACRVGEGERWRVGEHFRRCRKLSIGALLVWV